MSVHLADGSRRYVRWAASAGLCTIVVLAHGGKCLLIQRASTVPRMRPFHYYARCPSVKLRPRVVGGYMPISSTAVTQAPSTTTSSPVAAVRGFMSRAMALLKQFGYGMKHVFTDTRQAWSIYHRLKKQRPTPTSDISVPMSVLRREYQLLMSTMKNLKKLFPLIIVWIPPVIGFLPPILYVYFPRQIYTRQFWTEEESEEFMRIQYRDKARHYPALVKAVHESNTDEAKYLADMKSYTVKDIWRVDGAFADEAKGPLSLAAISGTHLRALAKANQINKFSWILDVAPQSYIRWALQRRAREVLVDDLMLRAGGLEDMSADELREACDVRGLPALGAANKANLQAQLRLWLSLYDSPSNTSTSREEMVRKGYWAWWPGVSRSHDVVAALVERQRRPSGREEKQTRLPPMSMLLHMPALVQRDVLRLAPETGVRGPLPKVS